MGLLVKLEGVGWPGFLSVFVQGRAIFCLGRSCCLTVIAFAKNEGRLRVSAGGFARKAKFPPITAAQNGEIVSVTLADSEATYKSLRSASSATIYQLGLTQRLCSGGGSGSRLRLLRLHAQCSG
jgi:hypothetical protein